MKPEGDPVQMNWIIQFYPKNGLDGALLGTSQTKKYKCIGSNMVNHAQDWSWVKKFFDLPNKQIPNNYLFTLVVILIIGLFILNKLISIAIKAILYLQ